MGISGIADLASRAYDSIASKEGAIVSALLFLFAVSKRIPNSKSGAIIGSVQIFFDAIAKVFVALGRLANLIGTILGRVVASDGFGGKK